MEQVLAELGPVPRAIGLRGIIHLDLGNLRKAAADLEFLVQAEPDNEPGQFQLGSVHVRLGQHDKTQKHFERYEALHGNETPPQP